VKTKQQSRGRLPRDGDFFRRIERELKTAAECQQFWEALETLSSTPRRVLRWNSLRANSREQFKFLQLNENVSWAPQYKFLTATALNTLQNTPHIGAGLAYIQDASSLEAPLKLNVKSGECVLDLCAAPGGKATLLGEALQGEGFLICNEVSKSRAQTLSSLLARHGVGNAAVFSESAEKLTNNFATSFDAILLDVPCSGESFFAKRKEFRKDVAQREVAEISHLQKKICTSAYRALKPGGRILYSTCTYAREENEDVVNDFVSRFPSLKLIESKRRWPHIDGVSGGYWALIEDQRARENLDLSAKFNELRSQALRWDTDGDLYASMMQSNREQNNFKLWPLSGDTQAMKYLRGEAITLDNQNQHEVSLGETVAVTWNGFVLGPAKYVDGRLNNLLPKNLRYL
jgi:16S rRNA C967 or C1407 C5-methylase (RsmB/RsmF family)